MKKNKILDVYEIQFNRGDIIEEELTKLQKSLKIKRASFTGIGAGTNFVVGCLTNHDPVQYKQIKCEGDYEITSFIGNYKDGKWHGHINLGNNIANIIGGHFFTGQVRYVLQLYVNVYEYYK